MLLFLTMCMDTLHAQLKLPLSLSFCSFSSDSVLCTNNALLSTVTIYQGPGQPLSPAALLAEHLFPTGAALLHPCAADTTVSKACQRTGVGKGSSLKLFFSPLRNQLY